MLSWLQRAISNDDVGVAKDTVFQDQEIRPGAGIKTGDLGKKQVWGATVEPLSNIFLAFPP